MWLLGAESLFGVRVWGLQLAPACLPTAIARAPAADTAQILGLGTGVHMCVRMNAFAAMDACLAQQTRIDPGGHVHVPTEELAPKGYSHKCALQ